MSFQITEAFKRQYNANLTLQAQQIDSRLSGCVRKETQTGEKESFDEIGQAETSKLTTRHGDTKYSDTPHFRRWVTSAAHTWADLIDKVDKVETLVDPTNEYIQAAVAAFNRAKDREIIAAFNAVVVTGKEGDQTVSFPGGQVVDITLGHASGVTNAGLTVKKIRKAKKLLDQEEGPENEKRYLVCSTQQIDNLLGTVEVTSSDYNSVKALVYGDVDSFLGFKFIRTELLPLASNVRTCFAWRANAMLMSTGIELQTRVDELPTKNYSTQVWGLMKIGAVRMAERGVIQIPCDETVE